MGLFFCSRMSCWDWYQNRAHVTITKGTEMAFKQYEYYTFTPWKLSWSWRPWKSWGWWFTISAGKGDGSTIALRRNDDSDWENAQPCTDSLSDKNRLKGYASTLHTTLKNLSNIEFEFNETFPDTKVR